MIEEKEKELFACAYAIALMAVHGVEPSEKLKAEFESKNAAFLKALNDSLEDLNVRIENIKKEVSNG